MHIGYLVPEFPGQTHAFFWRELQALEELGHEITLLSTRRPDRGACKHDFAAAARARTRYLVPPRPRSVLDGLAGDPRRTLRALQYVSGLSERGGRAAARYAGLLLCAADLAALARRRRLDHIHVHSCADAAHLAALSQRLGGPSYSLTLHGDLPVYGRDHDRKMSAAAFVSTVTRALQEQVTREVGLPAARVPVICMGVDTQRFELAPGQAPARKGALRIVTIARLNRAKGHRHALAAVHRLIADGLDVRYSIAGAGPERDAIADEIDRLGIGAAVRLLGTVSEADVLGLLAESDVFVLPSVGQGEAAPVSVMEAMSLGLPVVASIIGGTPDMIRSGHDGWLVEQGDIDGITQALSVLARDPEHRALLGRNARERAIREFDHRKNAERLARAIADATRAQATGSPAAT